MSNTAEVKHTAGPWMLWVEVYPDLPNRKGLVLMPEAANLGAGSKYANCGGGNVEANARLIAAAPELLEALENMTRSIELGDENRYAIVVSEARAALARAKGGEA